MSLKQKTTPLTHVNSHVNHLGATEPHRMDQAKPHPSEKYVEKRTVADRRTMDTGDDGPGVLTTVATVMAIESLMDSGPSIDTSPSIDVSTPTTDFGGFDGGSSGGGGASSDW